jgi:hypothetical protein
LNPPPLGLALIRIGVGALLLDEARRSYASGVGAHLIEDCAPRMALAPELLAWFGQEVLLRAPELFAWALVLGTALVGGAYFVGALARPASVALLALCLGRWAYGPPHERTLAVLLAVCAVGCFLADAGRRLGLDASLANRLPSWLVWSGGKRARLSRRA